MMDLRALMRDAERALIQRRSEDAYVILDEIVANGGIEAEVGSALFLKASGYEKGYGPRGVDYPRALDNYRKFISFAGDESINAVRGYIGAARVLAAIDEKQHAASVIECCENANRIRPTGAAANLIGYVMHEVLGDLQRRAALVHESAPEAINLGACIHR